MSFPLEMSMTQPEKASLLQLFFGFLFAIPQLVVLGILKGFVAMVYAFLSWWVILFTGKFPQNWWDYMTKYLFAIMQLSSYLMVLSDQKPSNNLEELDSHPLKLSTTYVAEKSRFKLFFGFFYIIPHFFGLCFRMVKAYFMMLYAFIVILFTGKYPETAWNYMFALLKLELKIYMFAWHITDEVPKNSIKE